MFLEVAVHFKGHVWLITIFKRNQLSSLYKIDVVHLIEILFVHDPNFPDRQPRFKILEEIQIQFLLFHNGYKTRRVIRLEIMNFNCLVFNGRNSGIVQLIIWKRTGITPFTMNYVSKVIHVITNPL